MGFGSPYAADTATVLGPANWSGPTKEAHALWHQCVAGRGEMSEFIARHTSDSVMFRPPTYYATWTGKPAFGVLLGSVGEVFGSSLRYHREMISPDGRDWMLEFTANVNGKELKGVDLMHLNEKGEIELMEVVMRPPNAVQELAGKMMQLVPPKMAALGIRKQDALRSKL